MICTIFCSTHVRPGDPLAECSNIEFEITSNESHITEARQYCRAQSHSRPVTGDRLVYDKGDKLSIDRRSLNSNHHLVEFFPRFLGRPRELSATRTESQCCSHTLAATKSTRLVANANRPEGVFAFSVTTGRFSNSSPFNHNGWVRDQETHYISTFSSFKFWSI